MSRNKVAKKKRHKTYKPASINPLSVFATLAKVKGFEESAKTDIKLPVRIAFENLRKVEYGFDDISTLYCAIKIGLRCSSLFDISLRESNLQAKTIISKAHDFYHEKNQRLKLDANELDLILVAVEVYEAVVETITPHQMTQILSDIREEILEPTVQQEEN
jgi:hypothetical protein